MKIQAARLLFVRSAEVDYFLTTFAFGRRKRRQVLVDLTGGGKGVLGLQMGVNIGRHLDAGMPQQALGGTKIDARMIEGCCISMAQHMRGEVEGYRLRDLSPHFDKGAAGHGAATRGRHDGRRQVRRVQQNLPQRGGDGDRPVRGPGLEFVHRIGLIGQEGHGPPDGEPVPFEVGPAQAQGLLLAQAAVKAQSAERPRPRLQRDLHQLGGLGGGEILFLLRPGVGRRFDAVGGVAQDQAVQTGRLEHLPHGQQDFVLQAFGLAS